MRIVDFSHLHFLAILSPPNHPEVSRPATNSLPAPAPWRASPRPSWPKSSMAFSPSPAAFGQSRPPPPRHRAAAATSTPLARFLFVLFAFGRRVSAKLCEPSQSASELRSSERVHPACAERRLPRVSSATSGGEVANASSWARVIIFHKINNSKVSVFDSPLPREGGGGVAK